MVNYSQLPLSSQRKPKNIKMAIYSQMSLANNIKMAIDSHSSIAVSKQKSKQLYPM